MLIVMDYKKERISTLLDMCYV